MNWKFIDERTLTELDTGFIIYLLEGLWSDIIDNDMEKESAVEIVPIAPKDMGFSTRALFLREGITFIKDLYKMESPSKTIKPVIS